MINTDYDDQEDILKNSPVFSVMEEDLSVHSVEMLKVRLQALRAEISRNEQEILNKADARQSAESFFK